MSYQATCVLLAVSIFGHLMRVLTSSITTELETALNIPIENEKQTLMMVVDHEEPDKTLLSLTSSPSLSLSPRLYAMAFSIRTWTGMRPHNPKASLLQKPGATISSD